MISIITPNYNGAKFIAETIESVLAQTFQDWEMLIVDDGSTDNSLEIIKKYAAQDSRIKLLQTDLTKFPKLARGPGAARNTAIDAAKGQYIAFLDSDDLWKPTKLEKQLEFLQSNNYGFAFTWYDVINEIGQKVGEHIPAQKKLGYKDLLKDCKIGCLTVMYDTKKIGKYHIDLNQYDQCADYSLWLKFTKKGNVAHCLQESLSDYRLVAESISSNKLKAIKHQWQILTKVEKLNFFIALYNFFFYLKVGIMKKSKYVLVRFLGNK